MIDVRKLVVATMFAAGFAVIPRTALGSEEFVQFIETRWRLTRGLPVPGKGCRLCHADDKGGRGTTTQPFGRTMFNRAGVKEGNTGSLALGLDYVVRNHTNSDGDPVPDYEEIVRDFTNPNDATSFKLPPEPDAGTGEGGASGAQGAGGDGTGTTPDYYAPPPASEDLPPPFYHGCSLRPRAGRGPHLAALLVIALALLRRVQPRARRLTARRD